MGNHKSHGKDKKKGSPFAIGADKAERDALVALCDRLDTNAAREIRRFMRERVAAHSGDTPALSGETGNGVNTDTGRDMPRVIDAASAEAPDAATVEPDTPAIDAAKAKKKRPPQLQALPDTRE